MANVNFNLRKTDSKEPQIIYLIFRHKTWAGKKLVYPLELKIRPKSPIGKAIAYALSLWDNMHYYTLHGHLQIVSVMIYSPLR